MSERIEQIFFTALLAGVMLATQAGAFEMPAPPPIPVVPGQIIVGVEPGVAIDDIAGAAGASRVRSLGGGGAYVLDVTGDPHDRAADVARFSGVRYAEPNLMRGLHVANDIGFGLKWDLDNIGDTAICDGSDCPTADADMDWAEAYAEYAAIAGAAVIAVIDTGIDAGHPDLGAKLIPGYDFLDGDDDPNDTYGHGTHVSGIAAAVTNNLTGTAGVAWPGTITVMPLKVCGPSGCPLSAIVGAINYAKNNGADVINMSLGGRFGSTSELEAIDAAWAAGLVIVASSGNGGGGKVSYPAAFSNVIAVGATNWHDQKTPYSNSGGALDVVAPGGQMSAYHDPGGIYSTMPGYPVYLTSSFSYSEDYDQLQGTSMSAPQVAGLAALLFAQDPSRTNADVRAIIESTTDDLDKPGWDRNTGFGRINVHRALGGTPDDGGGDAPPTVAVTNPGADSTVSGTVDVTATAGDDNGVAEVEFFVDAVSLGVDMDGTDGWSRLWDTTAYTDGSSHSVTAIATDTIGQTNDDIAGNVTVDNSGGGDAPPTVTVTNPVADSTVSGTVDVTANASDDVGVAEVEFFVDAVSLGVDTDGGNGWSRPWDTTAYTDGTSHSVTAIAKDTIGQTNDDTAGNVTVDNSGGGGDPVVPPTVASITPDTIVSGSSIAATIDGSGFVAGATVSFANGSGPTPSASNVAVSSDTSITLTVSTKSGGPKRDRVWDVVVTNPDGGSASLAGGLTVTP